MIAVTEPIVLAAGKVLIELPRKDGEINAMGPNHSGPARWLDELL